MAGGGRGGTSWLSRCASISLAPMSAASSCVGGERWARGTGPRKRSDTEWPSPRSCSSRPSKRRSDPIGLRWCSCTSSTVCCLLGQPATAAAASSSADAVLTSTSASVPVPVLAALGAASLGASFGAVSLAGGSTAPSSRALKIGIPAVLMLVLGSSEGGTAGACKEAAAEAASWPESEWLHGRVSRSCTSRLAAPRPAAATAANCGAHQWMRAWLATTKRMSAQMKSCRTLRGWCGAVAGAPARRGVLLHSLRLAFFWRADSSCMRTYPGSGKRNTTAAAARALTLVGGGGGRGAVKCERIPGSKLLFDVYTSSP